MQSQQGAGRKALITGITGQDGSYLAELLLEKGYEVHGIVRRVALEDPDNRLSRIRRVLDRIHLHPASLESYPSLFKTVSSVQPDEVYHLAAQSFVSYSFEDEFSTINTNINGTHHMLSCVREVCPGARFYFAGSSEMFGDSTTSPQCEETLLRPRSAYGVSKVAGYHLTRNYREAYNLHASNGILFNHESPRRGNEFVTRKIASHAARIKLGLAKQLKLGNLESWRDWGHAKDYVVAMWAMLQQDKPDDYVIASGETHSIQEFLDIAFGYVGLKPGDYVVQDPALFRPADVTLLHGDTTKATKKLGWKYGRSFTSLVEEMVESDLRHYGGGSRSSVPQHQHS